MSTTLELADYELSILLDAVMFERKRAEAEAVKRISNPEYYALYEAYANNIRDLQEEIMRQAMHPAHVKE
jgi:hypothetical protein